MTTTGVNQDREEAAGKNRTEEMVTGVDDEGEIRTEEMITGVEDEGVIRTEERKEICAEATLMATHAYTRNPESPDWRMGWTGGRTKEELFSGSDRWHQEKL